MHIQHSTRLPVHIATFNLASTKIDFNRQIYWVQTPDPRSNEYPTTLMEGVNDLSENEHKTARDCLLLLLFPGTDEMFSLG